MAGNIIGFLRDSIDKDYIRAWFEAAYSTDDEVERTRRCAAVVQSKHDHWPARWNDVPRPKTVNDVGAPAAIRKALTDG